MDQSGCEYPGKSVYFCKIKNKRSTTFTVNANAPAYILFLYVSDDQYAFFIDNVVISRGNAGIADLAEEGIAIAMQGLTLTVQGAGGELMAVSDMMGRTLYTGTVRDLQLPQAGIYFVRLGGRPAVKVVAVR